MTHARYVILIISLIFYNTLQAQSIQRIDVERAIEALFSLPDENINYQEFYERYFLLFEKPILLNSTNYSELKDLHVFSDKEINKILQYRDSIGHIFSIYELSYLEDIDKNKIELISPFLSTAMIMENVKIAKSFTSHENAYLITRFERRLEASLGFKNEEYSGDRNRLYIRYRNSQSNQYSVGLTLEKDPGEAFVFDNSTFRYGMDYWSAHLMIQNRGKLKRMIVGDYQLQFGQGLVFSSGLSVGKGAETINSLEKIYQGLRPYTSVIEGGYLRGISATYEINPHWQITPFFSSLRQDARLRILEEGGNELTFSTWQNSGLHRTEREIANKKVVRELLSGVNLNHRSRNGSQFGVIFSYNQFSKPINRGLELLYLHEFRGDRNFNVSAYGNTRVRQFRFFSEAAISKSGGLGILGGINGNLTPQFELALLGRLYQKNFHSLRSGAFGEGSRNINEEGIYLGLKYTFNSKLSLQFYYDRFRFNWLSFRINRPSLGNDLLARVNYNLNRSSRLYFQFRKETKDRNLIQDLALTVKPGTTKRFILHFDYQSNNVLSLRSKVQWSTYQISSIKTQGIAFFQDLQLRLGRSVTNFRFSIFDTEGGDNRQYAYEQDLLFAFSVPSLSGRGIRNYIVFKYEFNRFLDLSFKIARTTFFDRKQVGTGLNRIEGNKVTDLKLQAVYRF